MSKILVIAKYWKPFLGGIEDVAAALAERLAENHVVIAEAFSHTKDSGLETIDGVKVRRHRTLFTLKSQPVSLSYFFSVLFTRTDLVFFHAPNVVASAALVLRSMTPWASPVLTMHHMDIYGRPLLRRLALAFYDRILRKSTCLIVTSHKNKAISADIRVQVETRAIPLGVDPQAFVATSVQREAASALIARHTGSSATTTLLFIGRHARYKGLDVLIRAMSQLTDIHAIIAGDGPFRGDAQELADSLGISSRVHFIGKIPTDLKVGLLATCTVFAFPSTEITEAFGVSQLEAMAAGIPVVATDLPTGVTDVAVSGETALVVPPGDDAAFAAAVLRLTNDPKLRQQLISGAHARLMEKFTQQGMVRQHVELVESLLA